MTDPGGSGAGSTGVRFVTLDELINVVKLRADFEAARAEIERQRPACEMFGRTIELLQSSGLGVLGESLIDTTLPRLIRDYKQARDRITALEQVVEAALSLREAKKAMMRLGWTAHSEETAALELLFHALAALDAAQEPSASQ